jgi:hypothetical protein
MKNGYEVKTIYRTEWNGVCHLQDEEEISASDFFKHYKVLTDMGFEFYADSENRPHFKKYDEEYNTTVFVVFTPFYTEV